MSKLKKILMSNNEKVCSLSLLLSILAYFMFYVGGSLKIVLLAILPFYFLARTSITSKLTNALLLLVCLYPIYMLLIHVARLNDGAEGVDFAIFSQLIYRVAKYNSFTSSLISTEWQNFFTHHLSPYLYLLGLVAKLGIPPTAVLIGAHVVSMSALIVGTFKIAHLLSESRTIAVLVTSMSLLLPAVRTTLSWGSHDEVLALPFLIWSLYAHFSGKDYLKFIILIPGFLFKETLALNIFGISIYYLVASKKSWLVGALFGATGILVFLMYAKILPRWLWQPTFDGWTRISSLEEFFRKDVLLEKLRWFSVTLLPAVPFIFLHSKRSFVQSALLILVAAYNFGAIALTNFPTMYNPYFYYSLTPAFVSFLALILPVLRNQYICQAASLSLIPILFCGPTTNTVQIFKSGYFLPTAYSEVKDFITQDKVVIADDWTTSIFSENRQILRIFHANKMLTNFDYVVFRKAEPQRLSRYLRSTSTPCGETERFLIRCGKNNLGPPAMLP